MKYMRCQRCELNYVLGGVHCEVCKKELSGEYSDIEDIVPEENICPYCDRNALTYGEEMCAFCKAKRAKKILKQ